MCSNHQQGTGSAVRFWETTRCDQFIIYQQRHVSTSGRPCIATSFLVQKHATSKRTYLLRNIFVQMLPVCLFLQIISDEQVTNTYRFVDSQQKLLPVRFWEIHQTAEDIKKLTNDVNKKMWRLYLYPLFHHRFEKKTTLSGAILITYGPMKDPA